MVLFGKELYFEYVYSINCLTVLYVVTIYNFPSFLGLTLVLNKDGGVLCMYLSANFYVTSFDQEVELMVLFLTLEIEFDFCSGTYERSI